MKRLFILIFVIILCSCNSKDTDKSTSGGYDVDFSSIFIKKSDIKFKLDEKHFIAYIDKMIVTNKNYIIADQRGKQVLVFDRNGNLIYHIDKVGDGPGEFQNIQDIDVNNKEELLLLEPFKLSKFKLNGEFIKSCGTLYASQISAGLNDDFFTYNPNSGIKPPEVLMINHYNSEGKNDRSFCKAFFECGLAQGNLLKDEYSNLYVSQGLTYRVQIYSPDGKFINEIGNKTKYIKYFKMKNANVLPPIEDINNCTHLIGISINSRFILLQFLNAREPYKFSWIDIYDKKGNLIKAGIKTVAGLQIKNAGEDGLFYFTYQPINETSSKEPDYSIIGYELKE